MLIEEYTFENNTICSVARQLNNMNLKPRISNEWTISSVKDILSNPTYIGKIPEQKDQQSQDTACKCNHRPSKAIGKRGGQGRGRQIDDVVADQYGA